MAKQGVFTVLNPRGVQPHVQFEDPSPRLHDLRGKSVYCVSQHVRGTDTFVKKVTKLLSMYYPEVTPVYIDKPDFFSTDVPDLWDEIAEKANALIYAAAA
jgi:hypothetical protein